MSEQEKCPDCGATLIKSVPKKGLGRRGIYICGICGYRKTAQK